MQVGIFIPGLNGTVEESARKAYEKLTYRLAEDRSTRYTWAELWVWQYLSDKANDLVIIVWDGSLMRPTPGHILKQFGKTVSDCNICRGESDLFEALTQLSGEHFPRRSR